MLKRYNRWGITSLCSGEGDFKDFALYQELHNRNKLTARIFQNILLSKYGEPTRTDGAESATEMLLDSLKSFQYITGYGDEWVRIGAIKIMLDGGILTGTAYLREPWGDRARSIFGIEDPAYQGVLNYTREELFSVVQLANELDWKFTAHITGGGGVDLLLDVIEDVNRLKPVKVRRFSIIHGNFFSADALRRMKNLGIYADMQPAWFFKDADAMRSILGESRIKDFHPYRSMVDSGVIVNGGSDHMVKWNANTAVNPYNPFLAMWTMISRTTERGTVIMPAQAITREEALTMYTMNNAFASFEEDIKGSIEPGKLADIVVISEDILTCPVDRIRNIQPELTIVGGRIVYTSEEFKEQ